MLGLLGGGHGLPDLAPTPRLPEPGQVPTLTHFRPQSTTNYTRARLGIKRESDIGPQHRRKWKLTAGPDVPARAKWAAYTGNAGDRKGGIVPTETGDATDSFLFISPTPTLQREADRRREKRRPGTMRHYRRNDSWTFALHPLSRQMVQKVFPGSCRTESVFIH